MREKARKFVYLNTQNYISYDFLKMFYWAIFIIPFFMVVMGVYLLGLNGVNGKAVFPLVSIAIWTLLYWALVLTIKSKYIKKSFELRFLVNGIVGVLISSLMWTFFASWNLIADRPFLEFDVFLWMIPIYMLVSIIYVASIISGVHNSAYAKIKIQGKKVGLFSASVSLAAVLGVFASRMLRESAGLKIQYIVMTIGSVILIFVPILAHINFIQFFYCIRYNIKCDENGCSISSKLYPKKTFSKEKNLSKNNVKYKTFVKIVFIVIGILVAIFAAFCMTYFIIGFIEGFKQGISQKT